MLLAVIGDMHYGANYNMGHTHHRQHINTRLLDYHETFLTTIDEITDAGVTALVLTGDIFEHRRPTLVQQKFFSKALAYAFASGIKDIYIVIGNHDQQRISRTNTLSYLQELKLGNLHIADELTGFTLSHDGQVYANLILMPYRDRKWYGADTYDEARACLKKELDYHVRSIENNSPKILVGHMTIEGTLLSESHLDLNYENQLYLQKDMFGGIDITLMGHIHEPGVMSKDPYIAYVGSMEKRSGLEVNDKVYCIVDLAKAEVDFLPEPCRKIFDLNIDFGHVALGKDLHDKIHDQISKTIDIDGLPGAIIKISLRISASDSKFCDLKELRSEIIERYKVNNCLDIIPNVLSPRQARDDRITEGISDIEAFKLFLGNTIDEPENRKNIAAMGIDIIKQIEGELNVAD